MSAGERPYVCGICDRSFSQSNNLKAHMTLHNVNGLTPSSLEASHMGVSDDMSPVTVVMWPCSECGAQFTRRSKLERHRLSHSSVPRIVVITPSGLRLNAQQVTLHDSNDISVSAVTTDSSDVYHICPSVDDWQLHTCMKMVCFRGGQTTAYEAYFCDP